MRHSLKHLAFWFERNPGFLDRFEFRIDDGQVIITCKDCKDKFQHKLDWKCIYLARIHESQMHDFIFPNDPVELTFYFFGPEGPRCTKYTFGVKDQKLQEIIQKCQLYDLPSGFDIHTFCVRRFLPDLKGRNKVFCAVHVGNEP